MNYIPSVYIVDAYIYIYNFGSSHRENSGSRFVEDNATRGPCDTTSRWWRSEILISTRLKGVWTPCMSQAGRAWRILEIPASWMLACNVSATSNHLLTIFLVVDTKGKSTRTISWVIKASWRKPSQSSRRSCGKARGQRTPAKSNRDWKRSSHRCSRTFSNRTSRSFWGCA